MRVLEKYNIWVDPDDGSVVFTLKPGKTKERFSIVRYAGEPFLSFLEKSLHYNTSAMEIELGELTGKDIKVLINKMKNP